MQAGISFFSDLHDTCRSAPVAAAIYSPAQPVSALATRCTFTSEGHPLLLAQGNKAAKLGGALTSSTSPGLLLTLRTDTFKGNAASQGGALHADQLTKVCRRRQFCRSVFCAPWHICSALRSQRGFAASKVCQVHSGQTVEAHLSSSCIDNTRTLDGPLTFNLRRSQGPLVEALAAGLIGNREQECAATRNVRAAGGGDSHRVC